MRHIDPIPVLKRAAGAELRELVEGWNGDDIAYMLGTDRSRIAELRRGQLDRFSLETLIRYLTRGGKCVELRITTPLRPYRRTGSS
jgi:predicted XRE-type DNA-binding protein